MSILIFVYTEFYNCYCVYFNKSCSPFWAVDVTFCFINSSRCYYEMQYRWRCSCFPQRWLCLFMFSGKSDSILWGCIWAAACTIISFYPISLLELDCSLSILSFCLFITYACSIIKPFVKVANLRLLWERLCCFIAHLIAPGIRQFVCT